MGRRAGAQPPRAERTREGSPGMTSADLLVDAFGRIRESVQAAVAGLTPEQLAFRMDS